jgi:hypothetical protein
MIINWLLNMENNFQTCIDLIIDFLLSHQRYIKDVLTNTDLEPFIPIQLIFHLLSTHLL